jgi:hypothetical protein
MEFKEWWTKNVVYVEGCKQDESLASLKDAFSNCWNDAQESITQPKLSDEEICNLGEALDKCTCGKDQLQPYNCKCLIHGDK